jgi:hypothetical protein
MVASNDEQPVQRHSDYPIIVIVGAAGQMTSVTARALIERLPDYHFKLLDIDLAALERIYGRLASARVALQRLDLSDSAALRAAADGATLLIHGAGPFHRTASPVRRLCLDLGVHYLDIDDDVESTCDAIRLDGEAKSRGVGLFVGHGASPGFTNLLAVDLMRKFETVESVEVAWTVGDEGPNLLGRAVAEHTMHIGAGDCLTWRGGEAVTHQSFDATTVFPMGGMLGDYRLYECAHPEPITIPWCFPELATVACWGGLHPQTTNGVIKGVAMRLHSGQLSMDDGCAFLQAVMNDKFGSLKGWSAAISGIRGQLNRGENTAANVRAFLWNAVRSVHVPTHAGMAARVSGTIDGRAVTLVRQSAPLQPGTFLETMASITGLSAAAFTIMALEGPTRVGFLPPERWADGARFYDLCRKLGRTQLDTVVGPVIEIGKD